MIAALLGGLLAAQAAAGPEPAQIAHAIETNRLDQARIMLADAAAAGESGAQFDRLRADLAFARKNWSDARARYLELLALDPKDGRSAERAAIACLMLGDTTTASGLLDTALSSGGASWRSWNAKGVLLDLRGDWSGADQAFDEAERRAPEKAEVLNNRGWSYLIRGDWNRAKAVLEQAVKLDPLSTRTRNNLELSKAALAADLPARNPGETASAYAARLNDAGVVASMRGDRARAIAAFSRALEVSDSWYERAANNLERVKPK